MESRCIFGSAPRIRIAPCCFKAWWLEGGGRNRNRIGNENSFPSHSCKGVLHCGYHHGFKLYLKPSLVKTILSVGVNIAPCELHLNFCLCIWSEKLQVTLLSLPFPSTWATPHWRSRWSGKCHAACTDLNSFSKLGGENPSIFLSPLQAVNATRVKHSSTKPNCEVHIGMDGTAQLCQARVMQIQAGYFVILNLCLAMRSVT